MIKSVQAVDEFLQNVQAETRVAELMLRGEITTHVRELANEFDREIGNKTFYTEMQVNLHYLRSNISLTEGRVAELTSIFEARLDRKRHFPLIEGIRWPATLGLLILFLIFNVVLFYAVARHSRCSFIT